MCHGNHQYEVRFYGKDDGVRKFRYEATSKRCTQHTVTKRHNLDTVEFGFHIHAKPATEACLAFLVILDGGKKLRTRIRVKGDTTHLQIRSASAKTLVAGIA